MTRPDEFGSARPAHVIAVCNLKGGTGKSTLSINLACALAELYPRVGLVDNDEQGSATTWAARGGLPITCTPLPLAQPENFARWIRNFLACRSDHDLVLVDFPANLAPALAATLLMSSVILIPCAASELEIAATRRMMRHVALARAERADDPPAVLIVPTRVAEDHQTVEAFYARLAVLGEELGPPLGLDPLYDRSMLEGTWVGAHQPGSAAHHEILALADVVDARLAPRDPAPWPPKRSMAARRSLFPEHRPGPGHERTAAATSSLDHRPVPVNSPSNPKVIYFDELGPQRPPRLSLLRWAMRLVGSSESG